MRKTIIALVAAVLFLTLASAGNMASARQIPSGKQAFRLLNLSPDAGKVDFLIDDAVIGKNIDYEQASLYVATEYKKGSTHTIAVVPTGETNTTNAIFGPKETAFTDEIAEYFVLSGSVKDKSIALYSILDSFRPGKDSAHIMITNLLLDGPTLQIVGKTLNVKELKPEGTISTSADVGPLTFELNTTDGKSVLTDIKLDIKANGSYAMFVYQNADGDVKLRYWAVDQTSLDELTPVITPEATGAATQSANATQSATVAATKNANATQAPTMAATKASN